MKITIHDLSPALIVQTITGELCSSVGRCLLVMPTAMQNVLASHLPQVEFGNVGDIKFREKLDCKDTVMSVPPSFTEQGVRLQDFEKILMVECSFSDMVDRSNRVMFKTPADRTLRSAITPRAGRGTPEVHVLTAGNADPIVTALNRWAQESYPNMIINLTTNL